MFRHNITVLTPDRRSLLRTANQMNVENDGVADSIIVPRATSRADVVREICHHLAPFQVGEKPITGGTSPYIALAA